MGRKFTLKSLSNIDNLYRLILLVILAGVIFHAPISVVLSSAWPSFDLLFKSWKEILLVVALALAGIIYFKSKPKIPHKPLFILIGAFVLVCLFTTVIFYQGLRPSIAGLMIDLRYIVYFVLVLFATLRYPTFKKQFLKVGFVAALISMIFVILQLIILPTDFLKYLGYGKDTIMPYQTIDQSEDFIRINGTLRGPNPLGAFAMMIIILAGLWVYENYKKLTKKNSVWLAVLLVGAIMALWASYSRSAWIGAIVAFVICLLVKFGNKVTPRNWAILGAVTVILMAGLFVMRDSYLVSNLILHENPAEGGNINSNDQHSSSLAEGLDRTLAQPLGAGIGSTGSASLYGQYPLIIENQYLFIAHEAGWIGLVLFLAIFGYVLKLLFNNKKSWLALGVFASGVGLALIGLVLPVWTDDTVCFVWWGLAAVAIGIAGIHNKNDE